MERRIRFLAYALGAMFSALPARVAGEAAPMRGVPSVDLTRYAGKWHEIARLPNRFQAKCASDVQATYRPQGENVTVVNQCRVADGGIEQADGIAKPVKGSNGAKLRVSFFWPIYGDSRWSDALSSAAIDEPRYGGARLGRRLVDARSLRVQAQPSDVFAAAEQIGGERGWYAFDWLWRLRGALDLMMGGVGLRRGRSHPTRLRVGDVLDCWRVESIEPGRRLRLAAEMKVPGRAWLDFEVEPASGGAVLRQIASFDPHGLAGLAYWFAMYPAHAFVFRDMLAGIARSAEQASNKEM